MRIKNISGLWVIAFFICINLLVGQGPQVKIWLFDTDDSNYLELIWNENDSSNRTLNLLVSGANRSLTISEDATITANGVIDWTSASDNLVTTGYMKSKYHTFTQEHDNGSQSGPAYTINFTNGQKQKITLTGDVALTLSAPGVGDFKLKVIQDGTGGRDLTWTTSVNWESGSTPTESSGANDVDFFQLYYDGSNWWGWHSADLF